MIRKAVGAIVFKEDKFLLVHKVKVNGVNGKENIKGEWDFVKGGIEDFDKDKKAAILRELLEETGSNKYKIIKEYSDKLNFDFDTETAKKLNYKSQMTTLFLVEYLGNGDDLKSNDEEIDKISFFKTPKLLNILSQDETKNFFIKNCI